MLGVGRGYRSFPSDTFALYNGGGVLVGGLLLHKESWHECVTLNTKPGILTNDLKGAHFGEVS
jgi:hypothetical protein